MTLSTSATHPPTIVNLAQAHSALTALLALQAIVLHVWELTEQHQTAPVQSVMQIFL
jgi:hypothetical protein